MRKTKKGILFLIIVLLVAVLSFSAVGCTKKNKKKDKNEDNKKITEQLERQRYEKFDKFLGNLDSAVSKAGSEAVDKKGVIEVGGDIELQIGNSQKVGEVKNGVATLIKLKAIIDRKDKYKNSAFFAEVYNKSANKVLYTVSYYLNDLNTVYLNAFGQKVAFRFDAGKYTTPGDESSYTTLINKILEDNTWLKEKIASAYELDLSDKSAVSNMINGLLSQPLSKHFENIADAFGKDFSVKKALNAFIKDIKVYNKEGSETTIPGLIKGMIGKFENAAKNFGFDLDKLVKNDEIDILATINNPNVTSILGIETTERTATITKLGIVKGVLKGINLGSSDRIQFGYEESDGKLTALNFAAMLQNYKLKNGSLGINVKIGNLKFRNYNNEANKENVAKTFGVDLSEYKEDYKVKNEQKHTISGLKANLHNFSKVFPEGTIFDTVANDEKVIVVTEGTLDLFTEGAENKTQFKVEIKNSKEEVVGKCVFKEGKLYIEATDKKVGGVEAYKIMHYSSIHAIKSLLAVRTKNATFNSNVQKLAKDVATKIFANVYDNEDDANANADAIKFNKYVVDNGKAKKEFFFAVGPQVKSDAPKAFIFENINVVKLFRERFIAQTDDYKVAKKDKTNFDFINLFELKKPTASYITKILNSIEDFDKDKLKIKMKDFYTYIDTVADVNKDKAIAYSLVNLKGYVDDYKSLNVFKNTFKEIDDAIKNGNKKIIEDARVSAELALELQYTQDYNKYKASVKDGAVDEATFKEVISKYGMVWLKNILEGTRGLQQGVKKIKGSDLYTENGMRELVNKFNQAEFIGIVRALDNGIEEEYSFSIKDGVKFNANRKTTFVSGTNTDLSGEVIGVAESFDLANLTA